jgi:RNA polymerase sigma factor (sigma-70 family)
MTVQRNVRDRLTMTDPDRSQSLQSAPGLAADVGADLGGLGAEESGAIAAEAARGRALDRGLTTDLEHRAATTQPVSSRYIHELGQRASLPSGVEEKLVRDAIAGDREARAALVEAFLPLIGSVARNYRSTQQVTRVELMQEGVIGLLRALERFDADLGVPFWAYASWWVRQAMQQLIRELTRPVVLSDRALRQLAQLKEAHAELRETTGRAPTLAELVERTGVEASQLANLIAADRPPRALEEPLGGEEGAIGTFGELIADPLAEDEYENVICQVAASELRDLLSGLSDRERAVLRARFGLDGHTESLREIASRLGVSAERVRQLENRALGKLRAAATGGSGPD